MKITQDFKENKKAKSNLLASGKKTRNNVRYGEEEFFGDDSEEDEDDDDDEMFDDPGNTCGCQAALALTKWNKVGSALF